MTHDLEAVALTLVADGKGLLAADETPHTLTHRFDTLGIQSTEKSRRTYRKMLFTAGAADFISGVILQDETIRQKQLRRHAARPEFFRNRISCRASRSTPAPSRSPALPAKPSPKGSTGCGIACPRTARWALASRNGAR